ncbi:hypothetical protein LCGC14_0990620 [marine sediment metagenome]|uniref:Uncharacterized protein n=1 Tax=marine sediment metagenome TaxID=412755 RepID=A0A0F9NSG5_9ZZZZ
MTIKEILAKFGKRDKQFQTAQKEEEIRAKIEKRKLTPNERDLNRRLEEKRQEEINEHLKRLKDEERSGMLKSKMMDTENMFNKEEGSNMLRQKSIFNIQKSSNSFFS